MGLEEKIKSTIQNAIPDALIYIKGDGVEHFEAIVVSPSFEGIPLIRQHQMVMRPLKEAFAATLHALALKTFTPEKWETVKYQHSL